MNCISSLLFLCVTGLYLQNNVAVCEEEARTQTYNHGSKNTDMNVDQSMERLHRTIKDYPKRRYGKRNELYDICDCAIDHGNYIDKYDLYSINYNNCGDLDEELADILPIGKINNIHNLDTDAIARQRDSRSNFKRQRPDYNLNDNTNAMMLKHQKAAINDKDSYEGKDVLKEGRMTHGLLHHYRRNLNNDNDNDGDRPPWHRQSNDQTHINNLGKKIDLGLARYDSYENKTDNDFRENHVLKKRPHPTHNVYTSMNINSNGGAPKRSVTVVSSKIHEPMKTGREEDAQINVAVNKITNRALQEELLRHIQEMLMRGMVNVNANFNDDTFDEAPDKRSDLPENNLAEDMQNEASSLPPGRRFIIRVPKRAPNAHNQTGRKRVYA